MATFWENDQKKQNFDPFGGSKWPDSHPDSKVHGANMGPIRGPQDPGGPHVGPIPWTFLSGQASEVFILQTSKSSSNEHEQQYWCETRGNFLRKRLKIAILTYLGAQNEAHIPHTSKCSSNEHIKQDQCESSGNFFNHWKSFKKMVENLHFKFFGRIWDKKVSQIWPTGTIFTNTHESIHIMPVNQVSWSHNWNFLRKWPKT